MAKQELSHALSNLDEDERKELLKSIFNTAIKKENVRNNLNTKETIKLLNQGREYLNQENSFQEGDIVKWKPLLKNRSTPEYDEPAIVLRVLDEPLYDNTETGSTYFREPLDIVLGIIAEGEMISFHYDSRKLMPFEK